ncbi:hypothetical protein [Fusobacterium phage Fnu1]|uniref:Uncharacterized protein n=1 Tax=Fusobacterium phage Fnu1 TaxID=2530024 RepID=A0A481W6X1_9CAUD|nr:hypothetical protein KMD24_gp077 [Fusobacterium phage Fnu1]QBJ04161.1 hypothetical protein [Fusobacterium phage Fnu1]
MVIMDNNIEYLIQKSENIVSEANSDKPVGFHLVFGLASTIIIGCFIPKNYNYILLWLVLLIIFIIFSFIWYHLCYIITVNNYKEYRYAKRVLNIYYKQEEEKYKYKEEQETKIYIDICKHYLKQQGGKI